MADLGGRLQVFISYARSDCTALAKDLLAGLEAAGFDAFLDSRDIAAGEPWEARLAELLQKADTVVILLSPASVVSERCAWEVKLAADLAKRVIPVIGVNVTEADTPDALKRLNYIYFSEGHAFGASLRTLATALRTDVNWIREHTRLGELSARWRQQSQADALLLRGSELERAKTWLAEWMPSAPEPTELHRAFINQSESAEDASKHEERQRLADIAIAQAEVAAAQADKALQQAKSAKALAEKQIALGKMRRRNLMWAGMLGVALLAIVSGGAFAWTQIDDRNEKIAAQEIRSAGLEASLKVFDGKLSEQSAVFAVAVIEATVDGKISAQTIDAMVAASGETQAAGVQVRRAGGTVNASMTMSIDVFTCTGNGQSDNALKAENLATRLRAEQASPSGRLPFRIGRLRERAWTNLEERGAFIVDDEVRGEPDERTMVDALAELINADPALSVGTRMTAGATPTPYYLSVFFCSGQQSGGNQAIAQH